MAYLNFSHRQGNHPKFSKVESWLSWPARQKQLPGHGLMLDRRRSSRTDLGAVARDAAVAAATAAVVDYVFTPHRLTPGWELVLPPRSMALAYVAMAAAFAGSDMLLPKRQQQPA